jgi:hypothetical protein
MIQSAVCSSLYSGYGGLQGGYGGYSGSDTTGSVWIDCCNNWSEGEDFLEVSPNSCETW